MKDSGKRYIGLDVHKHYLIALGVDDRTECGSARAAGGTVPSGGVDEEDPDEAG